MITHFWIAWGLRQKTALRNARNLICFEIDCWIFQDSDILNLGTGSISWFEVNGYGCIPTYPTNITSDDPYRLVRPEYVEGCFMEYSTIEVIHSAVQLFFAVMKHHFRVNNISKNTIQRVKFIVRLRSFKFISKRKNEKKNLLLYKQMNEKLNEWKFNDDQIFWLNWI